MNNLISQYGLTQSIHEPTDILESSFSFIELIFSLQKYLATNSRTHSKLHPNSHYPFFFSDFNRKIWYSPPYECLICKNEKANADLIKRAIKGTNWDNNLFLIGVHDKVVLFNETMTFDDTDSLWLNKK